MTVASASASTTTRRRNADRRLAHDADGARAAPGSGDFTHRTLDHINDINGLAVWPVVGRSRHRSVFTVIVGIDRTGAVSGDFAITVFANIRSIDRFGRYGGEEFLLVLPDMSTENAVRTLDRLRAIIADLDWSAFSPDMSVTISAGIATLKPEETPDTFLARADSALYAAKAQGRNRITSA